jgi:hypothetical protein
MTLTTVTTDPAPSLDDDQAATVLVYALHTPAGVTVPVAAAALGRPAQWVHAQLDAVLISVQTLGPDLRSGHTRYQAAGPIVSDVSLLAGALLALAEHDWAQGEYQDDLGRVDITGALRLAAGVHPEEEMPGDPRVLDALLAAEDRLACELGYDPALVDAGDTIAAWQDHPARSVDEVRALLLDVAIGAGR